MLSMLARLLGVGAILPSARTPLLRVRR